MRFNIIKKKREFKSTLIVSTGEPLQTIVLLFPIIHPPFLKRIIQPHPLRVTCGAFSGRSSGLAHYLALTLALTPWLPLQMACVGTKLAAETLRAIAYFHLLSRFCLLPQNWRVPGGCSFGLYRELEPQLTQPKGGEASTTLWRKYKKDKKWALMIMSPWDVGICCYCSYT